MCQSQGKLDRCDNRAACSAAAAMLSIDKVGPTVHLEAREGFAFNMG